MSQSEVRLYESSGTKAQVFSPAQVLLPSYQPSLLKSVVHILLYITKEMSDLISMGRPWIQGSTVSNTSQIQVNFISQRMHRVSGLHEEVILPLEGKAFEKLLCCSYPLSFSIDWTHQSYRVWKTKCPILNPGNQPLPGQRVNIWVAGARNKPWLLWKGSVVLSLLKRSWSA